MHVFLCRFMTVIISSAFRKSLKWAQTIAVVWNCSLVVAMYVGGLPAYGASLKHHENREQLVDPEAKELAFEAAFGVAIILSCDCSCLPFAISKSLRFGAYKIPAA